MGKLIIVIAFMIFAVALLGVVYLALRFRAIQARIDREATRKAVAAKNPYTTYDVNFMVESGMTPEQIRKAVENAVDYNALRHRRGMF